MVYLPYTYKITFYILRVWFFFQIAIIPHLLVLYVQCTNDKNTEEKGALLKLSCLRQRFKNILNVSTFVSSFLLAKLYFLLVFNAKEHSDFKFSIEINLCCCRILRNVHSQRRYTSIMASHTSSYIFVLIFNEKVLISEHNPSLHCMFPFTILSWLIGREQPNILKVI